MSSETEESEESILYELLVYSEWVQEQEFLGKSSDNSILSWQTITSFLKSSSAAQHVSGWLNQQLPWLFAVGAGGRAVAILQDTLLEIRTVRDSYATAIGKSFVAKDPWPQWRKLQWSPDGTLLACAQSTGSVDVYDLLASPLFVIPSPNQPSSGLGDKNLHPPNALAEMVFIDTRTKNAHWSYELLCLDYYGQLHAYFVSPTQGFTPSHTFSFSSQLPNGITSVCADHLRHLLMIATPICSSGSNSGDDVKGVAGATYGLALWRILDDSPFYSLLPLTGSEKSPLQRRWLSLQPFTKTSYDSTIVKITPSPDGSSLAAIHLSGAVSIWALPSLKCSSFWPLDRQPGYDELSPTLLQLPAQRRIRSPFLQNPFRFHPVDVNWWSPTCIILARCSGAVTVCGVSDLCNKLGASSEFFDGSPRIGPAFDGTFLGIECELKVQRKRLQAMAEDDAAAVFTATTDKRENARIIEESSDDESDKQVVIQRMTRSLLYWVTDSERFQPPRKRPKFTTRTYRLLGFKRTTPDELYLWKLEAEEYGEALALARAYGLDCDLVYQRQWRNTTATIAAIHDYLTKVSKRNWVLRECLERVPDDVDAARELLLYGLKNTNLQIVVDASSAGGSSSDDTKWSSVHSDEIEATEAELSRKEEERQRELLTRIDFQNLTVEQKMLMSTRRRLLQYLDRLDMYEMILGGPHLASERFDAKFFEHFRSQSSFEAATEFARQGDWQAVATMFTFNGEQTLPHRLAICSCFPETLPPFEYRSLLPECDVNGEVFLWQRQCLRDPADWCECQEARQAIDLEQVMELEAQDQFYGEDMNKTWRPFRTTGAELTPELVSQWYCLRAADIDKQSQLVEHAIDLIKLGLERNVPHLENINHQLLTLETLVYDMHNEHITLEKLGSMSQSDVVQLLMSDCTHNNFLPTFHRWLLPFLRRVDALQHGRQSQLLRDFLLAKSLENLEWTLQVVANSKGDQPSSNPIIGDTNELISLAVDCIYSCQRSDQLEVAMKIYDCLPERPAATSTSPELNQLHDQLDLLQTLLEAADTLEDHGVSLTPALIAAKQNDAEQVEQLIIRLTRTVVRKTHQFTEQQWREILQDMLRLQETVFTCISPQLCREILVGSLLSCAKKECIAWAGHLLQVDPAQQRRPHYTSHESEKGIKGIEMSTIPFQRSKQLVLQAAQEYFNSSENLSDASLELASYCLGLITAQDEEIQEEKDLISAVHLMADYGIDMPPLKIRLSQNRLLLIDQVLKHGGKAYKNTSRLVRLGQLLRAGGANNRDLEGQIYVRIAETALVKRDLDITCQMCNKLRLANQAIGWTVCSHLARDDELDDLDLRRGLASFALVYCPEDKIEELLQLSWALERRQLAETSTRQIEMLMTYEGGDESFLALMDGQCVDSYRKNVAKTSRKSSSVAPESYHQQQQQQQHLLQTTAETTRQLVHAVRNTLKLTGEDRTKREAKRTAESVTSNEECNCLGLPVFYWSRWTNIVPLHESRFLATGYRSFSTQHVRSNSRLELLSSSWRMQILGSLQHPYNFLLTDGAGSRVDDVQLLVQLAESIFPDDAFLALGYWLDLGRPEKSWPAWTRLPSTEITLQLAAYYFAVQVMRRGVVDSRTDMESMLRWSPRRLIDHVCTSVKVDSLPDESHSAGRTCHRLLKQSLRLLADVSEAQQLRRLDGGVDINRFTTDDQYKRDSIVGLAITTDASVFAAAVRLAIHYGIPTWQVAFSHLTALFAAEDSISTEQMTRQLEEHNLIETLMAEESAFGRQMIDIVYPSVSGRDHDRLRLFFELFQSRASLAELLPLNPSVCLEILKKIQSMAKPSAAATKVDFKKLIRSPEDFIQEISPTLDADNVNILAKLAKSISAAASMNISASSVHSVWALKYFFLLPEETSSGSSGKSNKLGSKSGALTAADWLHRFETCKTHLQKLDCDELLNLVDGLCFSERSLDQLTVEVRHEICRRSLKYIEQRPSAKCSKSKKKANEEEHGDRQWKECASTLRGWCDHLDRLRSDQYDEIQRETLQSPGGLDFWRRFERSRAEESQLQRLLLKLLIENQPMDLVRSFIGIFPVSFSSSPEDVVMEAIRLTLDYLRDPQAVGSSDRGQLLIGHDALQVLMDLLIRARRLMEEDDAALISRSDIDDLLRQFYEDDSVDVHVRLRMLQMMPVGFDEALTPDGGSGSRLQLLRTLAAIQKAWADDEDVMSWSRDLRECDVNDTESRLVLVNRLLDISRNDVHLAAVADLLHTWPPFTSSDPESCPWILLWKTVLNNKTLADDRIADLSLHTVSLTLDQDPPLSDQCFCIMYETAEVAARAMRLRLHIGLMSSVKHLEDEVISCLSMSASCSQLSPEDYDHKLLDAVLKRPSLVARLAGTPLYGPLVERLLSSEGAAEEHRVRVTAIARQLLERGHRAQAGCLLQLTSGLPRYLLNFATSLYFARKEL